MAHVQTRPELYIRNTDTPLYLLTELIDNAADELLSGYADTIVIFLNYKDNIYSVADNGRGIPIKQKDMQYDIPIEIVTSLRTGGKFDNELYTQKSGLHGEGLTIVNFLSDKMSIITKVKEDTYYEYDFFGSDDKNIKPKVINKKFNYSTKISFSPNKHFFTSLFIDKDFIIERAKGILISAEEGKQVNVLIQVTYEDGKVENIKVENDILKKFSEKVDNQYFVETIYGFRTDEKSGVTKIKDSVTLYVGMAPNTTSFVFRGIVNTLPMDVGTHQQFFRKAFNTYLYEKAAKTNKYVDEDNVVAGINVLCVARLSDPSFTGQQKYSLAGGVTKYDYIFNQKSVNKMLDKHPDFVRIQLDIAQAIKMNKDVKKIEVKKTKTKVNVESLRDCSSKKLEERELYIVEGQSAGGNLVKGRDIRKHAILPLRGKILNVLNSSMEKIVDSKTLGAIFNSIGIKPNDNNLSTLRYNKIIIMADADPDGYHVCLLLISFFEKFASKLISEGKLFVGITPLFTTMVKNKFVPLYSREEMEQYKEKGYSISRIKGLGELNADKLAICAFDESQRKLIQVTNSNAGEIEEIWKNKNKLVEDYIK